jgi:hypothetical protein
MDGHMISVSWGDHLEFGEGDGALTTPGALERAIRRWRQEYAVRGVLWREQRTYLRYARHYWTPGVSRRGYYEKALKPLAFDEHATVIELAHANDMNAYVYISLFDEGWPLDLGWGGGFEGWQTYYVLRNPHHQLMDRSQRCVLPGVLCYAYPEVRQYRMGQIRWLLSEHPWDGVFLCTRSQSPPAQFADQFGFNPPIVEEFRRRYQTDILMEDFDLDAWRRLHGEFLTMFLREVASFLHSRGKELLVGIPRARYLGPPIGNLYLDWECWIRDGIVDALVIDQVAAICPSTWIWLWPKEQQGYGYVQNYLTGKGIPPLDEDLVTNWYPAISPSRCRLYLARMWHPFDPSEHERLLTLPGVSGLVFSSFHLENSDIFERQLWPQ